MTRELSARLRAVAAWVPHGAAVIDVGTDHALLPIHLVESGRVARVIASDAAAGPCAAARRNVIDHRLVERVSVRHGDGLRTVQPGEVDTIVIAGMGGSTATAILDGASDVVGQARRLILQPMNGTSAIRRWLLGHGWVLRKEAALRESGQFYLMLVAVPEAGSVPGPGDDRREGAQECPDPAYRRYWEDPIGRAIAIEIGPTLLAEPDGDAVAFAGWTLQGWQRNLRQMERSERAEVRNRSNNLAACTEWLAAWLAEHESKGARSPDEPGTTAGK